MRKKTTSKKRNSNFELLRILAMIMIVAHHFSVHGGFSFFREISFNKAFIQFLSLGGKIGVDIFVLLSGYFLIKSDTIKLKKMIRLWCQIFFYSVSFYLAFTLLESHHFGIISFLKASLPIIFNEYWFASVYFLLYLYIPYINKFLSKLDKNSYKKLLLTMFCCWSILPTFTSQSLYINEFIWFIFLYSFAGYLRLHYRDKKKNHKKYWIWATGLYIGTFLISIIWDILSYRWSFFQKYVTHLYGMEKIPVFLISVFLLLWFKRLNIKSNKKINFVASATFGVYLIHDNDLVRHFLWKNLFKNSTYATSKYLLFYAILVIGLVYIVCTIVELIRIKLLEEPFMKWLDAKEEKIEKFQTKAFKKLKLHK